MYLCLFVCQFVFVLHPLFFLTKSGTMWALSCECKIDPADFTESMTFLSPNFVDENSPNSEGLSTNTWSLPTARNS